MPPAVPPKRLKGLFAVVEKQGWTYTVSSDGHPTFLPPPGLIDPRTGRLAPRVSFSGSLGDNKHGDANSISLLRKLDVEIPRKNQKKKERP